MDVESSNQMFCNSLFSFIAGFTLLGSSTCTMVVADTTDIPCLLLSAMLSKGTGEERSRFMPSLDTGHTRLVDMVNIVNTVFLLITAPGD